MEKNLYQDEIFKNTIDVMENFRKRMDIIGKSSIMEVSRAVKTLENSTLNICKAMQDINKYKFLDITKELQGLVSPMIELKKTINNIDTKNIEKMYNSFYNALSPMVELQKTLSGSLQNTVNEIYKSFNSINIPIKELNNIVNLKKIEMNKVNRNNIAVINELRKTINNIPKYRLKELIEFSTKHVDMEAEDIISNILDKDILEINNECSSIQSSEESFLDDNIQNNSSILKNVFAFFIILFLGASTLQNIENNHIKFNNNEVNISIDKGTNIEKYLYNINVLGIYMMIEEFYSKHQLIFSILSKLNIPEGFLIFRCQRKKQLKDIKKELVIRNDISEDDKLGQLLKDVEIKEAPSKKSRVVAYANKNRYIVLNDKWNKWIEIVYSDKSGSISVGWVLSKNVLRNN